MRTMSNTLAGEGAEHIEGWPPCAQPRGFVYVPRDNLWAPWGQCGLMPLEHNEFTHRYFAHDHRAKWVSA